MSDYTALLQAKADAISMELAKYESDKANLEVAQRAGAAQHISSAKLLKLKAKIKGAKLRLSNAEKKLQEALALQVESSPDTPGSSEHVRIMDDKPNQSPDTEIPGPMDVDGTSTTGASSSAPTEAVNPPPLHAVPHLDANDTSEVNMTNPLLNSPPFLPSSGVSPSLIFPNAFVDPPPEISKSQAAQLEPPSRATDVSVDHVTEVSDNYQSTFKRLNLSESENEDDAAWGMSLMMAQDRAQLQQLLFKAGFTKAKPPKKRVKYVEVHDDSNGTGDSSIFDDEDSEITNSNGLAQPSKVVRAKVLPTSKGNEREMEVKEKGRKKEPKGKEHVKETEGGEGTEESNSKRKGSKKELKGGEKIGKETSTGDKDIIAAEEEGYHASAHSTAKAERVAITLSKQWERLADPTNHKQFVEDWLNAPTAAQHPEFPHGIDLIRYDPDYLPVAATINYRLALELMLNQKTNFICVPHVKLDRKLISHVDNLEGPIRIWGTALPRKQNKNIKSNVSHPLNHFHCGCSEKVALAGFIMWKTWKAKAMINGQLVVEGLHQHKAFQPREVLFILQFLKSKFGYTVEDMFTGSFDEEEELRKEAQVMKKVANFCARRHFELIGQELTLDNNISTLEEELVPEWI